MWLAATTTLASSVPVSRCSTGRGFGGLGASFNSMELLQENGQTLFLRHDQAEPVVAHDGPTESARTRRIEWPARELSHSAKEDFRRGEGSETRSSNACWTGMENQMAEERRP